MANQFKGVPIRTHSLEKVDTNITLVNGAAVTNGLPVDDTTPLSIDLINLGGTAICASNPLPVSTTSSAGLEVITSTKLVGVAAGGTVASTASSSVLPASKTGKLLRITLGGTAAAEAQIKNGAGTVIAYLYLGDDGGSVSENFYGDAVTATATKKFDVDVYCLDKDDAVDFTVNIQHTEV